MTDELRIRHRHRLRQKELLNLTATLNDELGTTSFSPTDPVETAEVFGLEQNVYILNNEILALEIEGIPFLSLTGLLKFGASRRYITVDSGAVRFVVNGADIMGPGVVGGDETVRKGQIVWIREEKYSRPLAIGRSIVDGGTFGRKEKGKCAESLFHVGDKLWKFNDSLKHI
ncbi:MAG: RNA-binding protein [Thermoplasmata archaeon]|nr:RNA-binding protein [Candidatus Sysuiplasma acidicola]